MAYRLDLTEGVVMLVYASIQKLAVLYLVIWTISPFMEIDMIWRLLALAAAAIWFLIAMIRTGAQIDRMDFFSILFAAAVAAIAFIQSGGFSGVLGQIAVESCGWSGDRFCQIEVVNTLCLTEIE